MHFDLLDGYLLEGRPEKKTVIARLLREPPREPGAKAFMEGIKMLGPRTPDLTLIALRLVLAGKPAADDAVVELKSLSDRARSGSADAPQALERYREVLQT